MSPLGDTFKRGSARENLFKTEFNEEPGATRKTVNSLIPDSRFKLLHLASIFFQLHPDTHSSDSLPNEQMIYEGLVQGLHGPGTTCNCICHKATFILRQRMLCPLTLSSLFLTLWLSEGVLCLYPSSIQKPVCKRSQLIICISILLGLASWFKEKSQNEKWVYPAPYTEI